MKKNVTKLSLGLIVLLFFAGLFYISTVYFNDSTHSKSEEQLSKKATAQLIEEEESGEEAEQRVKMKKERREYFFRLLRDPATNSIPPNIRSRELQHAHKMPSMLQVQRQRKAKNPSLAVAEGYKWRLAGPPAVGGRTRALGIDRRNPDIIIAGGVSGGIWKSTDGGNSWDLKTPELESFSVTYLSQDPTQPDIWYYSSGEYLGNSAGSRETSPFPAPYYGTGIFKSTDNGETWNQLASTKDRDTNFSSPFDYISRVVVSPVTGSVFFSSNGFGVFRSTDGQTFSNQPVIGTAANQQYSTVAVASDGTLAAVISEASFDQGNQSNNPGIYISTDDGESWDKITPSSFPSSYNRSVVTFAPSDPNILYVFTQKNTADDDSNQGLSFYKIDLSDNPANAEDRAANLPDFGEPVGGLNTQGGYDMSVTVKPDDPDFVIVGGTNLYRSRDGFSTAPDGNSDAEKDEFWIGGYDENNDISQYDNDNDNDNFADHHPDQHIQVYDPTNPDRMWSGNDGGVYVTDNVTAAPVNWTDQNDEYIVTQFYDASIPPDSTDPRLIGGTQDNGTPFFSYDGQREQGVILNDDVSSGDGGFSFFTDNYIFASNASINRVIRFSSTEQGRIGNDFAIVQPAAASPSLFVNPYAVDPNDETIMYYPSNNQLFRNTDIDEITNTDSDGASRGWEQLPAAALSSNYIISALSATTFPANTLYYAGSPSSTSSSQKPVIKKLVNANSTNEGPADISIPDATDGAFVHDIAVNPVNGKDVLVVMSNYSIIGLYHTTDGGESWQAVEGNLTGNSTNPGPSLRSATIVPATSGPIYLLGTSTGVYATQNLNGSSTQWGRESGFDGDGNSDIGYSVVENITSRFSDGDVAVGTHGRGMFLGSFNGPVVTPTNPMVSLDTEQGRAGTEVVITATNFQFSTTPSDNQVFFGEVQAKVVEASPTQLTVIVPRGTLDPATNDRTVLVSVSNSNGIDPQDKPFTILPPNENALDQSYPNPFTAGDNLRIPISLQNSSNVTVVIYDVTGQRVDRPVKDKQYQAGTFNIPVDFSGKASGVYIYRIVAKPANDSGSTFVDSKKFTFIK